MRHIQPSFNGNQRYDNKSYGNEVCTAALANCANVYEYVRSDAAKKGWARSPVKKSVNANPLKRTWKEVLVKVLFQMVAKIKAFPTTADGDKTAMMTDVEKSTALRKETWCSLPQSSELKLADSWYREVQFVVLDMLYSGSMVHEKHHRQLFR